MKKVLSYFMTIIILGTLFSFFSISAEVEDIFTYEIKDDYAIITKCSSYATGEIIIPDSIQNYNVKKISDKAFQNCQKITKIVFSKYLESVGNFSFSSCIALKNIEMNENLKEIGKSCFVLCGSLTSVIIPESVNNIGPQAFLRCCNLENINVDINNSNYSSYDGSLYNKNQTEIICYPMAKKQHDVELLNSVITIGNNSFVSNEYITSIILPKKVETIGEQAFTGCTNLNTIDFSENVTTINDKSFKDCAALSIVYGYYNTIARTFSEKNNINFIRKKLLYDASGDGKINSKDLIILRQKLLGCNTCEVLSDADSNEDGIIDIRDYVKLKKYLLQ